MAIELLSALCPLCTLVAGPGAPLAQHSPVWSAPSLHSVASSSVPASLASFATLRDFPALTMVRNAASAMANTCGLNSPSCIPWYWSIMWWSYR